MHATVDIPFPLSSFPGANPQEGGGRLINCYAEPLAEASRPSAAAKQVWRGTAGLSQHNNAATGQTGYRGGLIVKNLSYEAFLNQALTVDAAGNVTLLGNLPGSKLVTIARNQAANPDVIAVDLDNGAYILNTAALANATVQATVAGGAFNNGDTVAMQFVNTSVQGFPVTVTYTVGAGSSANIVAAGLSALINANATLAAANLTSTVLGAVLTISHQGAIGNSTTANVAFTGTGSETVTFNNAGGAFIGGAGTPGIVFVSAPLAYNGLGNLPQPNSVAFQDGYFFFTIADGRCFATPINSLSLNALTYIICVGRADVTLLRAIAFNGYLLLFTTGSFEIWQDASIPAPGFPYARQSVVDIGLIQSTAIAGHETGFANLGWVGQDYGVWLMPQQSFSPTKVSPPDLDRLIEAQVRAGNTLEAGCRMYGGKKFWHISSPAWSWELNLTTMKWHELWSLNAGVYGRWRAVGGHQAFNRWIFGDMQSGNLLYADDTNYTENGAPLLFRIESGPVLKFPEQLPIARADFEFVFGVGQAVGTFAMTVLGAASGTNGVIRLTVNNTAQANSGDQANVAGVGGTVEANGTWPITVIDAYHIELVGSKFVNAFTSGGTVLDATAPPGASNPSCAISCSKNGGQSFDVPSIRSLAPQGKVRRSRASVKNRGQAGPSGVRWRVDITDPVYRGLMGGTMSSDERELREVRA